jgi:nucleotide-binding universal stress UspA family protein
MLDPAEATAPALPAPTRFNVLMAYDGSAHSQAALALVEDVFQTCAAGRQCFVSAMTVLPTQQFGEHEALQAALDAVAARLEAGGMPVETILKTGNPAASLIAGAEELRANLLVLGAQGLRATLGVLLGGVTQQVVEYANAPVLVVRAPYSGIRRVLVVVDGSSSSRAAVEYLAPACPEARHDPQRRIHGDPTGEAPQSARARCSWLPEDAAIRVLNVLQPLIPPEVAARAWTLGPEVLYPAPLSPLDIENLQRDEEQAGQAVVEAARSLLASAGLPVETALVRGDPAAEILQYARDHRIDLIVCGSRGLNPVSGWLLGSVSRKLVHYASCSVLIVK